jgi:hypothetical protein
MSGLSSGTGTMASESSTVAETHVRTESDGLFRMLLVAQQSELVTIRREVFGVVVGWRKTAFARQRKTKSARHGRARAKAGLAFGSLQARFSIERAHGGSLKSQPAGRVRP